MSVRILLMLPLLYRKWGAIRLRHMDPWIAEWSDKAPFAGILGQGADDAWHYTSLLFERARLKGDPLTVVAADISIFAGLYFSH